MSQPGVARVTGGRVTLLDGAPRDGAANAARMGDHDPAGVLGLLGLRIFEATGADITDLGEEHGHRVLRVIGKGTKVVLVPLPPEVARAIDRAVGTRTAGPILLNTRDVRMDRTPPPGGSDHSPRSLGSGCPGCIRTCSATPSSRPCWMPAWTCVMCRSPPGTPIREPPCAVTVPART